MSLLFYSSEKKKEIYCTYTNNKYYMCNKIIHADLEFSTFYCNQNSESSRKELQYSTFKTSTHTATRY